MSSTKQLRGGDHRGDALRRAFVELLAADPSSCDAKDLARLVRAASRLRGWVDAIEAGIAARAARLAVDASTVISDGGRRGRREAEAVVARGAVCARMPSLSEALLDGTISAGHVDAIAVAARGLDEGAALRLAAHEESLVAAAVSSTPEQFERECRDLARNLSDDGGLSRHERLRRDRNVRRWVDKHSGMCKTLLSLDPLADATMWTAINAAVAAARSTDQHDDDRTWDQLQADVVVGLLTTGGADPSDRRVPEVSVLIDERTLLEGIHGGSTCETSEGHPLPVATVRRLCCDGELIPIVLGGAGEVLDVGRQQRVANRAQRRALRAMYRTCGHPDCDVPFDACRIHHVVYWRRGGTTDLANMLPLCECHHHLVHEGGWVLQLFPDRRTIWSTPDGTVYFDGVTLDRRPGRQRQRCRVDPVTEVAAELEHALAAVLGRPPP